MATKEQALENFRKLFRKPKKEQHEQTPRNIGFFT